MPSELNRTRIPSSIRVALGRWFVMLIAVMAGCAAGTSESGNSETASPLKKGADFSELVESVHKIAGSTPYSYISGKLEARVESSDPDKESISIAIDDLGSESISTSRAVVYWQQRDGVWRVTSMTSDWEDGGLLSIIAEQDLVNQICRAVDDQFTPPRGTPEQDAQARKELQGLFEDVEKRVKESK